MPLYTRGGDDGTTGLFGGARVSKHDLRLEAYGTLDELNSILGVLRLHTHPETVPQAFLARLQGDLLVLGAILATPTELQETLRSRLNEGTLRAEDLEQDIDRLAALAPPLKTFILPGGCPAAAHAHHARTVCRRAERIAVALGERDPQPQAVLVYLNRLSDWLFALARAENQLSGVGDAEWKG